MMAWILHFLFWMTAVTASSYKFPLTSQRLRIAPLQPDYDTVENVRSTDYRVNERSIANSHLQNVQSEVRIPQRRVDEPIQGRLENGSSKTLNQFLKPGRRRGQINSQPITFPGPTELSSRSLYQPEIPESCRNSTFCEDVPNYPQEEIDQLISKLGRSMRFQIDRLDVPDTPDINQRVGAVDENIELCAFDERIVYPRSAKGADGKWYSLVNRKDNPVQGYKIEVCNFSNGEGCSNLATFQPGYEGTCRQRFVYRSAAVFEKSAEGLKAFETSIKLPSCCICAASHTIA